jgi:hypothetical protein
MKDNKEVKEKKENIWTEKVFTGPRYFAGTAMTVGIILPLTLLLLDKEMIYVLCGTFFIAGVSLWIYAGYRGKEKNK